MLDLNDHKYVEVSYHGRIRKNKLYKVYCDICNIDRGYKPKCYKHSKCNSCAQSGKTIPTEVKEKMMIAALLKNTPDWTPKNKQKITIRKKRIYVSKKNNIQRHISKNMRCLLNTKLRQKGLSKFGKKTFSLIGYTVDDLIAHLESKFQPGMTWENYGAWEIDHAVPDSWFNYSSTEDEDFKKSWSLNNLQPLWKADNAAKGARYAQKCF